MDFSFQEILESQKYQYQFVLAN